MISLRKPPYLFAALLLAAFAVRLVSVFATLFIVRADEIFQNMEPAHRLVTGYGVVTWEWRVGLRSWLLPVFYAVPMKVAAAFGFGHAMNAVRIALAFASLGLVGLAVVVGRQAAGRMGAAFCGIAIAFWPDCVLYGPRTLSEAQGGELLAAGALLAGLWLRGALRVWLAVAIGFLLALSVMVRVQYLPASAMALIWCAVARPRALPFLIAGVIPAVALEGGVDWWIAGTPFAPLWVNFHVNYLLHRADTFGTQSVFYYPFVLMRDWGALTLPLVAGLFLGGRSLRLELATALAVILCHTVIPHKEPSFVFGAIPLLVVVSAVGLARWWGQVDPGGAMSDRACAVMIVACVLTALSGYRPDRLDNVAHLHAMRVIARTPGICGVGQFNPAYPDWSENGGYSVLDRPVPLYFARNTAELAAMSPGFDMMIAPAETRALLPASFGVVACWRKICVLRRSGGCAPTRAGQVSAELEAWGQ